MFRRYRWAAALCVAAGLALINVIPVAAAKATLRGIDVSHHNGQPSWAQVDADGVRFAFAKATEGATFQDSEYASNKQRAEAQLISFGAYHFARPDKTAGDAIAEADNFIATAALDGDNLLPVLDLEVTGGLGAKKLKAWTKAWLAEVQAKLGVKAIIYTNPSFWRTNMRNTQWFANHGFKLWVAHWTSAAKPTVPASNWGGRGWTVWQYDNCGSIAGIDGCVDLDRYKGASLDRLTIKNNT